MENNHTEIRNLIDNLNYYTKLYDEGHPQISDKEWDNLYFKLVKLENEIGIYYEDSPTQRVNYQVVNKLNKVEHSHPMLSLDKTKDINVIKSFLGNKDYIAMAKMDGLTCSLTYENEKLIKAETRGNGIIGEDILHNALQVKNIPNKINYKNRLVVDGEIICTYKDFEPFANEYKNPRNFASGSIRLLDSKESAKRNLSFIAWDIIEGFEEEQTLHSKLWRLHECYNFNIVPYQCERNKEIEELITKIQKDCKDLGYPIDGLVFKYDKVEEYNAAGRTEHHFKGGIAFKFYDEVYETRLKDVEWSMGRTGKLTPVAIFNPIDIDGTEVNRASLHNISIMEELGIKERGQLLEVFKSNMIIPQVKRIVPEMTSDVWMPQNIIHIPEVCPICGSPTKIIQENDSKVLYCDNPNCEGKCLNRIEHFFSKKGLDIKGISKATIEKLIDWGWVNEISDIFTLSKYEKEWKTKPGFGEKSVDNILNAIKEGCNTDLESVISAAGIPLIGRTVARELTKRYQTYDSFKKDIDGDFDFSSLDGFGYEMNKSLKNYNYKELDYIVENFLILNNKIEENKEQNLKDLIFCITGKTHLYKNRAELQKEIEDKGGRVVSSISSKVNYLINNDINSTSTKNTQAKKLNIPILSEEEFKVKFI